MEGLARWDKAKEREREKEREKEKEKERERERERERSTPKNNLQDPAHPYPQSTEDTRFKSMSMSKVLNPHKTRTRTSHSHHIPAEHRRYKVQVDEHE